MKGLIVKELIQLKKGIKGFALLGICVLICLIAIGTGDGATFGMWAWFTTASIGIMNADVSSGFNRYNIAMPVNRGDIIKSKYVTMSIYDMLGYLILFAGEIIYILRTGESVLCEMNRAVIFIISSNLAATISVMCIFWRGIRRGQRVALPVSIVMIVSAIIGLRYVERMGIFETPAFMGYLIIALLATFALRVASLPLSIKLYEKRSL